MTPATSTQVRTSMSFTSSENRPRSELARLAAAMIGSSTIAIEMGADSLAPDARASTPIKATVILTEYRDEREPYP